MGKAEWGADPEFFGPRHAHRERRIVRELDRHVNGERLHLECAAGVGSLSLTLARAGLTVVSADRSLRSLVHMMGASHAGQDSAGILPVVADITRLPFADGTFGSATSAETLEHIDDDRTAVQELGRVLSPGGWLVGTVPADPEQWSDWDDWGGHLRRYEPASMTEILTEVGPHPRITVWGWPLLRLYDDLFLKRVNRRRLQSSVPVEQDPALRRVSNLGRKRWLVRAVRGLFELDRPFDGVRWGVGLLFAVQKPGAETDAGSESAAQS
jgi:SAM-dependent methyltransferase